MLRKFLLSAFLAGSLLSATVATRAAQLVAHWDFEKFYDGGATMTSVVGGYVGTVQGTPTIVPANRPGGGGNGLSIAGGGQGGYLTIDPETSPDNMVNKAAADDALSVVFWQKNNRSPAEGCCDASTFWFESPSSPSGTRGVQVHVPWSNGEIMFDNSGCCTAGRRLSVTPAAFDFEQWHHYALIKNQGTKQIWIDGILAKESTGADPLPNDFAIAKIGSNGTSDGHKSPDATIDDFALFKGALTEAEIKSIASGSPIGAPVLIAYWDFEKFDDGGTTISSKVGGYVGAVQGSPKIIAVSRPGGGGNGLDISGGGQGGYITIDPETSPDNMVNKAAADDSISIAFWQKNNRSPAEGCCDASSFWFESPSSASGTRGVQVHIPWSNGEVMFDNSGCCTAGRRLSVSPAGFDFEQWHHYVFIKDQSTKQIWIDGIKVKESTGADPLPLDFTIAKIGSNGTSDGHKSPDATLDDFALYKGALRQADIKALAEGAPVGGAPKTPIIAHWDFEKFDDGGVSIKSTVGGYVGMVQGSPAIVPISRPGGGGKGLDISGGGQGGYITIDPETSPDNMVKKAAADDSISIAFWQKNNRSPAEGCCDASTFWFESPSSPSGTRGVQVHIPWSNGEIMFDNSGCCTAGRRLSVTPAGFDFEQWHHYVFIKDKGTKQIWIDGTMVKESTGADPLPSDFTIAKIGSNGTSDGHKSPDATIDDFILFKGAVSAAEIKALASGGGAKPPDNVAPTLISAAQSRRPINNDPVTAAETVVLKFSEEVAKPSSTTIANYSISPTLAITKAEQSSADTVVLTTAKPAVGTSYTVTVKGVQDTSRNTIAANSTISFNSFSMITQGVLRFALYGNITDTGIQSVTGDARYPASPDFVAAATALDNLSVIPDDNMVHYGATITGLLTPKEPGDYDFFIRGNQSAQLWINSNGSNPEGAEQIAADGGASKNFLEPGAGQTSSSPLNLAGGKSYFIQLIYKREANSGDLCQVAWRKTTDTTPAAALNPIPGQFFTAIEPALGPSPEPPKVNVARGGAAGSLIVTWTGGTVLERSDSLSGPWTTVAGAKSPHAASATGLTGFYRVR